MLETLDYTIRIGSTQTFLYVFFSLFNAINEMLYNSCRQGYCPFYLNGFV